MPVAIKASRDSGPGAAIGALMGTRAAQFAWFLGFALLTRASVFGDTNYFNDEYFYFQTGIRMHQGLLPYVDIWDRKGPGLFLTYWLIAFFSHAVIAYQIAALLFAAATAQVAALIAARYTGRVGAILAGTLYLTLISWLGGGGGQTPVFYNLWMALAALGVVRAGPAICRGEAPRQLYAAMASAGLALTYKQSAIVECLFLGLWALWQMARSGVPRATCSPGRSAWRWPGSRRCAPSPCISPRPATSPSSGMPWSPPTCARAMRRTISPSGSGPSP